MNLQIDSGALVSNGRQVIQKGDEFKGLLNKIKTSNANLKSYWEGTDASKYSSAVEEQAKVMDELAEVIGQMGELMVNSGNAYREAREKNASSINN